MGFNRENYRRIKEEYDGKYLKAAETAQLRRAEVHTAIPEVCEIDRRLSSTGLRVFEAALRGEQSSVADINAENSKLLERRARLLKEHGFAPDYTEIRYECALCGDTGAVGNRMCQCMRKKLIEAGFESSGMYGLIKTQRFDNFRLDYYSANQETHSRMTAIFNVLKKYAEDFDRENAVSIAMFGNTGLGKTHLSSALAGAIIEKGNDVYYTGAMNMFADFEQKRFGNSISSDTSGGVSQYYDCDLLIIDDLGTEVGNQFTVSCLYNVINTRINRKRPTVLSTNLTQDEFRKRYWDRIASRVFGEFLVLPFCGTDIRAQKLHSASKR